MIQNHRVAVVGGGPAGLATALALVRCGVRVVLVPGPARPGDAAADNRTAALFTGSIELLRNLGIWQKCEGASAPVAGIRLIDDTEHLLRAPEVLFTAFEIELDVFGFNVPNAVLTAALAEKIAAYGPDEIEVLNGVSVAAVKPSDMDVTLALSSGDTRSVALVAAADGRGSPCRAAAGIETQAWSYPQAALTCTFAHSRDHDGISTEFHRAAGPCTVVPMPGLQSSLVWVESPEEAQRLAALGEAAFRDALAVRLQGLLGAIGTVSARQRFPLSGMTATRFAARRIALIGEAAHVFPPIGAQGLNLSLRDAAVLAELAGAAVARGGDAGGADVLAAFDTARRGDIAGRVNTIDALNRSLLWSGLPPVHLARGAGLAALKFVGPLRRRLLREGLMPSGVAPRLMQPSRPCE